MMLGVADLLPQGVIIEKKLKEGKVYWKEEWMCVIRLPFMQRGAYSESIIWPNGSYLHMLGGPPKRPTEAVILGSRLMGRCPSLFTYLPQLFSVFLLPFRILAKEEEREKEQEIQRGWECWAKTAVSQPSSFHSTWDVAKAEEACRQLKGMLHCQCGVHIPQWPSNKWLPPPKPLWHSCISFVAHQCAAAQWLKIAELESWCMEVAEAGGSSGKGGSIWQMCQKILGWPYVYWKKHHL